MQGRMVRRERGGEKEEGEKEVKEEVRGGEEEIEGKIERRNKLSEIQATAILQLRLTGHKTAVPHPHHSPQTARDTRHSATVNIVSFSPRSHPQSPFPVPIPSPRTFHSSLQYGK